MIPRMPQVLNMRDLPGGQIPAGARYVGRGRGSRLGNPFVIGKHGSRAEVIAQYEQWLDQHAELQPAVAALRGHDLVCWCAPLACHADVLLRRANA